MKNVTDNLVKDLPAFEDLCIDFEDKAKVIMEKHEQNQKTIKQHTQVQFNFLEVSTNIHIF